MANKEIYIVYGGDATPYEPTHIISIFADKNKAEEAIEILRKQDEYERQLDELYDQYYEYLEEEHLEKYLNDENYDIITEALSKKFNVTKEFAYQVLTSSYFPQYYSIRTANLIE